MNAASWSYTVYLGISIMLTMWVARTLSRSGRVFLVDAFHGNAGLADAVNHLLVVGFYLINVGYVALAMKYGDKPLGVQGSFEFLSTKVGMVLLILGSMHFFNLAVLSAMRRRGIDGNNGAPIHVSRVGN